MPTASIVELCEGIVTALNNAGSGEFSQDFTAIFKYVPEYTLPDAETLRVVITDAGGEIDYAARRYVGYIDRARVVILKRVDADSGTGISSTAIGEMLLLADEITEFLAQLVIADEYKPTGNIQRGDATDERGQMDRSHYFPGDMEKGRTFASSLTFEYERTRKL